MSLDDIIKFPEKPGIYKITSPSGKIYIGESLNLKQRCLTYLNPNRLKKQRAIYNSLIKDSVESHEIEIIELCEVDELLVRERFWQEHFNSVNDGLNCFYSKTNSKKKVLSQETRKIMSDKAKGEKNVFFGKKHNQDSLKKISQNSKGEKNPNFGGKFKTDDWLRKQSISNSKKHLIIEDIVTNEIFNFKNSKEASNFLGCSSSTIRSYKAWGFVYKKRFVIKDQN